MKPKQEDAEPKAPREGNQAQPSAKLLAHIIGDKMLGLPHGSVFVDDVRIMCRCGLPFKLNKEIMPHLKEVQDRTGFNSLHGRRLFWDSKKDCEV